MSNTEPGVQWGLSKCPFPLPKKENITMVTMITTNIERLLHARCWVKVIRGRKGKDYYIYFVKETKAQSGQEICRRSHNQPNDRTGSPPSHSRLLPPASRRSLITTVILLTWGTQHSPFATCPHTMLDAPCPATWLLSSCWAQILEQVRMGAEPKPLALSGPQQISRGSDAVPSPSSPNLASWH